VHLFDFLQAIEAVIGEFTRVIILDGRVLDGRDHRVSHLLAVLFLALTLVLTVQCRVAAVLRHLFATVVSIHH